MNKRIWNLYKELRRLRRKVKTLEKDLEFINRKYNILWYEKKQEKTYDTKYFTIPNMYEIERLGNVSYDSKPRAEYLTKKLTDSMKIQLFDDLCKEGYITKIKDDSVCEVYEIKVVK